MRQADPQTGIPVSFLDPFRFGTSRFAIRLVFRSHPCRAVPFQDNRQQIQSAGPDQFSSVSSVSSLCGVLRVIAHMWTWLCCCPHEFHAVFFPSIDSLGASLDACCLLIDWIVLALRSMLVVYWLTCLLVCWSLVCWFAQVSCRPRCMVKVEDSPLLKRRFCSLCVDGSPSRVFGGGYVGRLVRWLIDTILLQCKCHCG